VFSSASGIRIGDKPEEFFEVFDSMIEMDDPRHARLRRIVSRAFTPKMIQKFADDVERTAGRWSTPSSTAVRATSSPRSPPRSR
jgi:methyl-branched lipid omega-hydroxylase